MGLYGYKQINKWIDGKLWHRTSDKEVVNFHYPENNLFELFTQYGNDCTNLDCCGSIEIPKCCLEKIVEKEKLNNYEFKVIDSMIKELNDTEDIYILIVC